MSDAPHIEAALLKTINEDPLSAINRKRYRQLARKQEDAVMTDDEQSEFTKLIDTVEMHNVDRVDAMIELARLRHTSFRAIVEMVNRRRPKIQ